MNNQGLQGKYGLTIRQINQMTRDLKLKKSRASITPQMADFIKANYLKISGKSIASKFGIGAWIVQRFMKKNGLKVPHQMVARFRSQAMVGRTTFTEQEDAYIRDNYLTLPVKALGLNIGRSYTGVMGRLKQMGLSIPPEVIERNRQTSMIQSGHTPFNKGRKQSEYMSPEAIKRTAKTRFAKGNLPHNTASADGKISVRHSRSGNPYKYIRLSLAKWVLLHKHNWEKENGPVPPGHCLWAKDGDSLNTSPDNWELITRKENRIRNSGTVSLNDNRVSFYLSPKDKDLREEIKTNHPELINIKRKQLLLNRAIHESI